MDYLRNLFGKNEPPNIEQLKAKRDVKGLIKAMKYKKDIAVQYSAMEALGDIKDVNAVDALIAALKSDEWNLRSAAASSLGNIGDVRAFKPLIPLLLQDSEHSVRESVMWALAEIDKNQVVEKLITALKNKNPSIRQKAVYTLGRLKDDRSREHLFDALQDENSDVRNSAMTALAELKDMRVIEMLLQILKDTSQGLQMRIHAAEDLAKSGDERAAEPIIAVLLSIPSSDTSGLAMYFLRDLEDLGDARAIAPIIRVLQNSQYDKYVRGEAALRLAGFKDPRVIPALRRALSDITIRSDVEQALYKAGG